MTTPRIIRVFPRLTNATPTDELARINVMPGMMDEADAVHISVAFTCDLARAEYLQREWNHVAPATIGGPATGMRGEVFVPGMYLANGYTITSRGCPNRCWFCEVWKRDGGFVRELPICDGWNVLDDNLLACSDKHIRAVFAMLAQQKQKPQFTGGLEPRRLLPWHAAELRKLKPAQVFFAYDTPDDYEPLVEASRLMLAAGLTEASHAMRCYLLCGYPTDTFDAADKRVAQLLALSMTPYAIPYRDKSWTVAPEWARWARQWMRPAISHHSNTTDTEPKLF